MSVRVEKKQTTVLEIAKIYNKLNNKYGYSRNNNKL